MTMFLHKAVQEGNISEIKKLLKEGTGVNSKDKRGNTVLHLVQDKDIASLLLNSFSDFDIQNDNGDSVVHTWCMPLLGSDLNKTISLKQQILAMFLEAGASTNIQNHLGYSGLHTVFVYGGRAGIGLDIDSVRGIVNMLIKYNANVNLEDFEGCTPLHHAIREPGMTSITELLLQAKANVNAKDRRGMTPLHYLFDLDDQEMLKLLLRYDCDVNEQDVNGTTTLSYAALEGNELMVELLLNDPRTNINLGDSNGITPLHLAAAYKHINVCEMLIAYAVDVNARDVWNATPLHYAAYGGTPEIVSLLLQGDANHKLSDNLGYLPIQYALDRHYFHTAIAFGENYLQDIKSRLSTSKQIHGATNLEDHILRSFPADDVLNTIVPASKVYSDPYDRGTLPPDTMDYIKLKTSENSAAFVRGMIEVPGIGRIPDNGEANKIRLAVENYIQKLASTIAEVDPRFRGSLLCSGSVYEGTKICDPDEFDYMLCLEKFEQICTVDLDETTPFDNVKVVSKHTNFADPSFEVFFEENQLQSDSIMNKFVEVARKAISQLNFSTDSNQLYLQSLTEDTLVDATWILPGTVTCNLKFIWNGLYYKQLVICVDLVPSIHISSWPHCARRESLLLTDDIKSMGCHVVSKCGYWRLSFSLAEKMIMENLPYEQKLAFIGAKVMLHPAVLAKITLYDDSVLDDDASNISDQDSTNEETIDVVDDTDQEGATRSAASSCLGTLEETLMKKQDVNKTSASTGENTVTPCLASGFPGTIVGKVIPPTSSTPVTIIKALDKQAMLNLKVGDRVNVTVGGGRCFLGSATNDDNTSDVPAKTIEPRDVISTYLLKMVFFHCIEESMTNSPGTTVTTDKLFEQLYVCLKEKLPLPYYFMQTHNLMDKLIENEDLCETEFVVMMLYTFFNHDDHEKDHF